MTFGSDASRASLDWQQASVTVPSLGLASKASQPKRLCSPTRPPSGCSQPLPFPKPSHAKVPRPSSRPLQVQLPASSSGPSQPKEPPPPELLSQVSLGPSQPPSSGPSQPKEPPPPELLSQVSVDPSQPPSSGPSQPKASPPPKKKARRTVSVEEYIALQSERDVAMQNNIPWQMRGPPPTGTAGETWRGQVYRRLSGKWANRGGVHREWYTGFYQAKKQGKEAVELFLKDNPKP